MHLTRRGKNDFSGNMAILIKLKAEGGGDAGQMPDSQESAPFLFKMSWTPNVTSKGSKMLNATQVWTLFFTCADTHLEAPIETFRNASLFRDSGTIQPEKNDVLY